MASGGDAGPVDQGVDVLLTLADPHHLLGGHGGEQLGEPVGDEADEQVPVVVKSPASAALGVGSPLAEALAGAAEDAVQHLAVLVAVQVFGGLAVPAGCPVVALAGGPGLAWLVEQVRAPQVERGEDRVDVTTGVAVQQHAVVVEPDRQGRPAVVVRGERADFCRCRPLPRRRFRTDPRSAYEHRDRPPQPATGKRRREVTVDELFVLAYALGVPPLLLVLPLGELDEVPVPPGGKGQHPHLVWRWATGEEPPALIGPDGRIYAAGGKIGDNGPDRWEAWRRSSYAVELYGRLWEAQKELRSAETQLGFARSRHGDDDPKTEELRRLRQDRLASFGRALDELINAGYRVPGYSRKWVEDLRALGVVRRPEAIPIFEPKGDDE